ncbi:hypothetical protein ALC57_14415 [Trachymyrmex cornetzi]|uniref:Uncharacterized protein n=1 Tax=Trachymyrmex cornetzi TaxID=471704 RepID=A0A195DKN7_9HYME|nr:hypothetical protein ALC57_14415 [Trachymyrmex cornetzi]
MVLHTASASQIAVPGMSLPAEEDIMVIKEFEFFQGLIKGPFLGMTPRFFTRWQHLDGAFCCRELRLVSLETCSNVQRVGRTRS